MNETEKIDRLYSAVYGNGKEGLVEKAARMEAMLATQIKHDDEFRAYIRGKTVYIMWTLIVLALMAGGSPFAAVFIEKTFGAIAH